MSKLERLLNLTAVLLDTGRPLSAEQIRTRVTGYPPAGSAFHRAFERDKDDLRVLGIPVQVDRVPATDPPIDGYLIKPEEYYLPDPNLNVDELAALRLASLAVRVDGLNDEEALWKLGGVAGEKTELGEPLVASLPTNPALVPMFQAVTKNQRVTFSYGGTVRIFDPWRMDFTRGRWYISGFDQSRDAERSFRLDRIEGGIDTVGPIQTEVPEEVQSPSERKGWELGESETVEVELLVNEGLIEAVSRQLGANKTLLSSRPDGSAVFSVPVTNQEAFRSFALGFLEHVEVLSPPSVRSDIISWLEECETRQWDE